MISFEVMGHSQSTLTRRGRYYEVPNKQSDQKKKSMEEKNAILLAYLLSKSKTSMVEFFRLLHEKLKVWWTKFPKNPSEHARS